MLLMVIYCTLFDFVLHVTLVAAQKKNRTYSTTNKGKILPQLTKGVSVSLKKKKKQEV